MTQRVGRSKLHAKADERFVPTSVCIEQHDFGRSARHAAAKGGAPLRRSTRRRVDDDDVIVVIAVIVIFVAAIVSFGRRRKIRRYLHAARLFGKEYVLSCEQMLFPT